ncbi:MULTISPECIES: hypothetical protein [Paenibacillus]|uniref:hypothetical protein n=1 Tax=Paenibacillus TaxID=44249 RepID=UPI000B592389|nr:MULTISPECIES: hypothetical protein [Paenibacillus]
MDVSSLVLKYMKFSIRYIMYEPEYGGFYTSLKDKKVIILNTNLSDRMKELVLSRAVYHHYTDGRPIHFFLEGNKIIDIAATAAPTAAAAF